MAIELLNFQLEAASALVQATTAYFQRGADRIGGRDLPFVGQLKAVTGAGKTPVLTSLIGHLGPSVVLWTTKFGSVVDQTTANLRAGGKYHHLFGERQRVEVIPFGSVASAAQWQEILEREDGITVLVSTVAAWNSNEKDDRLNVHRTGKDWGGKSRWDQLKTERKRRLWVVYDEAHNTTVEQVEQLDDLDPAGFFVASASPIGGKLNSYLSALSEVQRKERIVPIRTSDVVKAQLLKSTISLADYEASYEEMLRGAASLRDELERRLQTVNAEVIPKSIYVVETSGEIAGVTPRPISIWRTLTADNGIDTDHVAICTNTKNLPKDARRVERISQLEDQFSHIIFNKKLQEGWDDPSVYICYFDGKTESATRIQQVIGRALRQPNAQHFEDGKLNTAYFFIHTPHAQLEQITEELKRELRIYKEGTDEPDDFEPFRIVRQKNVPPPINLKPEWQAKLKVTRLQLELPRDAGLEEMLKEQVFDFSSEDCAAPGKAVVRVVSMETGETREKKRDLLEDMRVVCGDYLGEQIRMLSRNCAHTLHPDIFADRRLRKTACYGSKALKHYRKLAEQIVDKYEESARLGRFADPDEQDYTVGEFQASSAGFEAFQSAGHPKYDRATFNKDEMEFAKQLDKFTDLVWVRNKDRTGYGIPLPVKSGASSVFYPDFIWWVGRTVWALDPTGKHILNEKLRHKLLMVPEPLHLALITKGRLLLDWTMGSEKDGWSLARYRHGNLQPEHFVSIHALLTRLKDES